MSRVLVSCAAAARYSAASASARLVTPGARGSGVVVRRAGLSSSSSASATSRTLGAPARARGFASGPATTTDAATQAAARAVGAAVGNAATKAAPALPPPPPRRRFLRTLLAYSLGLGTVFYAGSAVAALNNDRYQDFFVESVPLGERILELLAKNNLDTTLTFTSKDADVSSLANRVFRFGGSAISSVSESVDRIFFTSQEKAKEAERRAKEAARSFQERAEHAAKDVSKQASAVGQRGKEIVSDAVNRTKDAAKSVSGNTAQSTADSSKSLAVAAGERTKEIAQDAVAKVQELSKSAADKVSSAASRAEEALPVQGQPVIALPERLAQAKSEAKPTIVALPERAGRASQDAAAFAKYRTVAAAEQARLQAQQEIERLHAQFEQLKQAEAKRAGRLLEEQEAKFRADLAKAQAELDRATKKAEAELRSRDAHWSKELEREREKQKEEHARALQASLDAQNDLIDARLKEEVIARGIELQKKWTAGVKAAVDKERGGRLAKLEELAKEASSLEKLALENERFLEGAARVHSLTAAVRALSTAALGTGDKEGSQGDVYAYRTPFRAQIEALKRTAKEQTHPDVYEAALATLDAGGVDPDAGVESETTLQTWFKRRIAPKVLSVALLPDPSAPSSTTPAADGEEGVLAPQPRTPGVLAHLVSATLSPLLAKKTPSEALVLSTNEDAHGRATHDDIPTVLARAEFWLEKGKLDEAVREVNRLKGWGKTLAADWLAEARKRLVVQQALDLIDSEAKLASLRVA